MEKDDYGNKTIYADSLFSSRMNISTCDIIHIIITIMPNINTVQVVYRSFGRFFGKDERQSLQGTLEQTRLTAD